MGQSKRTGESEAKTEAGEVEDVLNFIYTISCVLQYGIFSGLHQARIPKAHPSDPHWTWIPQDNIVPHSFLKCPWFSWTGHWVGGIEELLHHVPERIRWQENYRRRWRPCHKLEDEDGEDEEGREKDRETGEQERKMEGFDKVKGKRVFSF